MATYKKRPSRQLVVPVNGGGSFDYNDYDVYAAAWSLDGRLIYLGGDSGEVFALDLQGVLVERGGLVRSLLPSARERSAKVSATITALAVSVQGDIAAAFGEGQVVVWSEQLKRLWSVALEPAWRRHHALAWSPDGLAVAVAAGSEGVVRVWRVGSQAHERCVVGERGLVSLVWSEAGMWALDEAGLCWRVEVGGGATRAVAHVFEGPGQLVLGADGALWCAARDGVWRVEGELVRRVAPGARRLALDPGERGFVTLGERGLEVWRAGEAEAALRLEQHAGSGLLSVALSPDGRWAAIAAGRADGALRYVGDVFGYEAIEASRAHEAPEAPRWADGQRVAPSVAAPAGALCVAAQGAPERRSGVIAGDVWVGCGAHGGPVALCLRTGRVLWAEPSSWMDAGLWGAHDGDVIGMWSNRLWRVEAATGAARWSVACDASERSGVWGGEALIAGGSVYVAMRSGLVALSWASGERLWRYEAAQRVAGPLVIAGGLLCAHQEGLVGLDMAFGEVRWRSGHFAPALCAGEGVAAVAGYQQIDGVDAGSGATLWSCRIAGVCVALVRAGSRWVALSAEGELVGGQLADGGACWRARLGAAAWRGGGQRLCAAGDVVVAGWGRAVVAVGLADGQERWRREVEEEVEEVWSGGGRLLVRLRSGALCLWGVEAASALVAQPPASMPGCWRAELCWEVEALAVSAGCAVVQAGAWLWMYRLADGAVVWRGEGRGAAALARGFVVAGGGVVRALDEAGRCVWTALVPGCVGVSAGAGRAVVWSWDRLWALDVGTGAVLWSAAGFEGDTAQVAGALVVSGRAALRGVGLGDGEVRWSRGHDDWRVSWLKRAVAVDARHLVVEGAGVVTLVDGNGWAVWSAPGRLMGADEAAVYVWEEGALVAYEALEGAERWRMVCVGELLVASCLEGSALRLCWRSGWMEAVDAGTGARLMRGALGGEVERAERVAGWGWAAVSQGALVCCADAGPPAAWPVAAQAASRSGRGVARLTPEIDAGAGDAPRRVRHVDVGHEARALAWEAGRLVVVGEGELSVVEVGSGACWWLEVPTTVARVWLRGEEVVWRERGQAWAWRPGEAQVRLVREPAEVSGESAPHAWVIGEPYQPQRVAYRGPDGAGWQVAAKLERLSGACVWGERVIAWGERGMIGHTLEDGAVVWAQRWGWVRDVCVSEASVYVAGREGVWVYEARGGLTGGDEGL